MKYSPTGVSFHTSDANLQRLYDAAEASLLGNIVQFTPTQKALVEGGGYRNVWIETQPMGGEMYAKRNLEVALNNQILFLPPGGEHAPDPRDPSDFKRYWIDLDIEKLPPPTREEVLVPFASMDVMAYSFEGRATLAEISHELGNGREAHWQEQAEEVRQRLIKGLWDPERSACFDRDRTGKRLEELIHNNLRCMWYGVFTQEMADAFIRRHLLNPAEFWTPVPLPSIAVNEPLYRSVPGNNWSGQPMGLTYQRAIPFNHPYV